MKKKFTLKLGKNTDELLLHKGSTYWHSSTDKSEFYKPLEQDEKTQVCIVGGGMSGALIANQLLKDGLSVIILDKMQPGHGSSNGNTGIIQYSSDRSLLDFIKIEGEEKAKDFYQLCHDSMKKLFKIIEDLNTDVGFTKSESIFITQNEKDEQQFKDEVNALLKYNFPAQLLSEQELYEKYQLVGKFGILTSDDARINPFKLISALHKQNIELGAKIFGNTYVNKISRKDMLNVETENGYTVQCDHIVFCTGYMESYSSLKDRDILNSTYSMVTQPIEGKLWDENTMIWDNEDPYLYFRVTEDRRIIAGGFDEETAELSNLTTINQKALEILNKIKTYYPTLEATPHFAWQSVFGVSKDEIPFIGKDPKHQNVYYALGFGGNGTCYSVAAADILTALIQGQQHKFAYVVDPSR